MTINEFKAWLDGFSAAIGDAPTPEQWALIKAKIGETVVFAPQPAIVPTVFRTSPPTAADPLPFRPYTTCSSAPCHQV